MHIKKLLKLLFAFIAIPFALKAQVTTGSISGSVKAMSDKAGLAGASIEAIHEPTGTKYTTVASKGGRFDIANVNAGGPYTIKASFVGFTTETVSDITITIGETQTVNFSL
jgi:hypothetical protein